ncbi:signal recognition particle-docking protein FtsY [Buchnera aphidicola (Macrosiphoniella sanborni)]|uniref:Signal recognition particle receptor FtsY n=1 Tax=Buchnera aphidicola (Macrosiphoniella sanborni) TaxID=1241865 RepID=A0A4D6Y1X0_9GAMM|nr:signal recognition particle-docking protein FtsY [Buchnera aphidicola]QCI23602.1 signal recognition particle-docking protein FtsY [Buchnera aphidicola (Macrosiphoniella sanborni)]
MINSKKGSFFSWLSSKIKKQKTKNIIQDNNEKKNNDDYDNTKIYISENTLMQNGNIIKEDKLEVLNNCNKKIINDINHNNIIKKSFFSRLKRGLKKTKQFFNDSINNIFLSKTIDDVLFEELEEKMLLADIGINTTHRIINNLIADVNRQDLKSSEKLYFLLKQNMYNILKTVEVPLKISRYQPFVILVVGVNGAGKTTTVSKLAKKYKSEGKSVMLAAADTFRAAGIEQLQILGKLNSIPVIAQHSGSDPAAVIFDAIKSAKSKKIDVLIIDTAGRLHNKLHLIEELKKIVRVIKKIDISAPHEKMLIVDSCNGQNTIQQTEIFHRALNLTGIVITKLDGTAKGGVIFSLADQFKIPIRYIGIGEDSKDLGVFNSQDFIQSLFTKKENIIK